MIHRLMKAASPVLQAALKHYLRKPRPYSYRGIKITVNPGIFFPRFIYSTRIMLDYIDRMELKGKKVLEIGTGSGIIALLASRKGAIVTATDINPSAVENTRRNAEANNIRLNVILADLFADLREMEFDLVIITPPYYPRDPDDFSEMAWYCGSGFEYFLRLFSQLNAVANPSTEILMILSEDCDIRQIKAIAAKNHFDLAVVHQVRRLGEWNFIFRITRDNRGDDSKLFDNDSLQHYELQFIDIS